MHTIVLMAFEILMQPLTAAYENTRQSIYCGWGIAKSDRHADTCAWLPRGHPSSDSIRVGHSAGIVPERWDVLLLAISRGICGQKFTILPRGIIYLLKVASIYACDAEITPRRPHVDSNKPTAWPTKRESVQKLL
jgi:hypothetical protein